MSSHQLVKLKCRGLPRYSSSPAEVPLETLSYVTCGARVHILGDSAPNLSNANVSGAPSPHQVRCLMLHYFVWFLPSCSHGLLQHVMQDARRPNDASCVLWIDLGWATEALDEYSARVFHHSPGMIVPVVVHFTAGTRHRHTRVETHEVLLRRESLIANYHVR